MAEKLSFSSSLPNSMFWKKALETESSASRGHCRAQEADIRQDGGGAVLRLGLKRFELGYLDEPVDGAAVDQRREHAAAGPEGVAHRAHAQHDVQLGPNKRDEVLEDLQRESHT